MYYKMINYVSEANYSNRRAWTQLRNIVDGLKANELRKLDLENHIHMRNIMLK